MQKGNNATPKQSLFAQIANSLGSKTINKKKQAKTIGGAIGKSSYDAQKGGTA